MNPALTPTATPRIALALLLLRLSLISLAGLAGGLVLWATNGRITLPPGAILATWTILPVNLASLGLVWWAARRSGVRLRDLICGRRCRPWHDVAWAMLWSMVLGIPFLVALNGALWLLTGDLVTSFETGFVNAGTVVALPSGWAAFVGVATVLTFVVFNGPTEELLYRGLAQSGLNRTSAAAGLVIPAVAFGAQHAWFASTWTMGAAMAIAFTVWGLGAGIIARRQGRLLPLIICHVLVNASTSAPAAIIPLL